MVAVGATATIRRRSVSEAEFTNGSCTPKWLADMLPEVDFDPCTNSRSHIRARHTFALEAGTDGLVAAWIGRGFINWPFSSPMPWVRKLRQEIECGNCADLIVLCKHDASTQWWRELVKPGLPTTIDRWDFHARIQYDEHPAIVEARRLERVRVALAEGKLSAERIAKITGESSANFPSAIVHHRGVGMPSLDLSTVATKWVLG